MMHGVPYWCGRGWLAEWCYCMRSSLSHLPPHCTFSPVTSRWRLHFGCGQISSYNKIVPTGSWPPKVYFFNLCPVSCPAWFPHGGPVVWHLADLSPSHPMERAWDSHILVALFLHLCIAHTTFARSPKTLVCERVPAARSLVSWGLQLENPTAGIGCSESQGSSCFS